MATKRVMPSRVPVVPYSLLNAKTGEETQILFNGEEKEFVIGRSPSSSLIIEVPYMSRRHAIISVVDDEYTIYDCNTIAGTFINFTRIETKKVDANVLRHGDLISFANSKGENEFIYKFCVPSSLEKKPKLESQLLQIANSKMFKFKKDYTKTLSVLHTKVVKIREEHSMLKIESVSRFEDILQAVNVIQGNIKSFSEGCNAVYDRLIKTIAVNETIRDFKAQITMFFETDFQCSICSEIMINNRVLGCSHSFCEDCLLQWMDKNPRCPICRKSITSSSSCLVLNTFVTNVSNLITNAAREERTQRVSNRKKLLKFILANLSAVAINDVNNDAAAINVDNDIVDLTSNTDSSED